MHVYVLLKNPNLGDMSAARQLMEECIGKIGQCRGPAPMGMGLVYELKRQPTQEEAQVIGLIPLV